jgi:hypothetical protein
MSNGDANNDSNVEMKSRLALQLAIYLVVCTVVTAYSVYTLWALHSPKSVPAIAPPQNAQPQNGNTKTGTDASSANSTGSAGTTANASGANTKTGAGTPAAGGAGAATADKTTGASGGGAASGGTDQKAAQPDQKAADKATAPSQGDAKIGGPGQGGDAKTDLIYSWTWLGLGPAEITGDARLLLLVLLMGAFGSSVYSLKSLGDYRGDNKLKRSWALFYIVQPFEGSGIAVLMYLVVRGGFLSGTTTDVNVFGTCAIAGLAGAFSDTAFMKLNEVFNTLFKPQDNRGGKIDGNTTDKTNDKVSAFTVSTPSPLPDGTVGQAYKVALKADNGTGAEAWSVAPALPGGLSLGAATGVIMGTPATAQAATSYTFTVKDSSTPPATATKSLSLTIH